MRSNLELFIAGELAVELKTEEEVIFFFNAMNFIGLTSVNDNSIEEIKNNVSEGRYIVEYIPGQGFMFDTLANIRAITMDMFMDASEIVSVDDIFVKCTTVMI